MERGWQFLLVLGLEYAALAVLQVFLFEESLLLVPFGAGLGVGFGLLALLL